MLPGLGEAAGAMATATLATDTGQTQMIPVLAAFFVGIPVLLGAILYLFWALVDLARYGHPGPSAIRREASVTLATGALAIHMFGLFSWYRFENEYHTCSMARFGTPDPGGTGMGFENLTESAFPPTSVCHWADGHTEHLVPVWVNPATAILLACAVATAVFAFRARKRGADDTQV